MNIPNFIKIGESDRVEFKEKFDDRTSESTLAFANTAEGYLIIKAEAPR